MALSALLVVGSLIFAWEQQRLKQIADDKTIKAKVEEQRALESEHRALESEKRAGLGSQSHFAAEQNDPDTE